MQSIILIVALVILTALPGWSSPIQALNSTVALYFLTTGCLSDEKWGTAPTPQEPEAIPASDEILTNEDMVTATEHANSGEITYEEFMAITECWDE